MILIIKWFANALSLYLVSLILPGFIVRDFITALISVVVIGLVNAFIKPILLFFTLPINLVTLGLFTFVINALMLLLAARLIGGFEIDGLLTALIGSILLSVISTLLTSFVK